MPRAMNKHGFPGIRKRCGEKHHRKPYYARISNGMNNFIYSKNFETAEEAAAEYARMKDARVLSVTPASSESPDDDHG